MVEEVLEVVDQEEAIVVDIKIILKNKILWIATKIQQY
jgi:hypothetical protein